MTDEPEQSAQAEQTEKPVITADISKLTIGDMRAIARFTTGGMDDTEAMILVPRLFDALERAGLEDIPLEDLNEAVTSIWAAVGKSMGRSTNGS